MRRNWHAPRNCQSVRFRAGAPSLRSKGGGRIFPVYCGTGFQPVRFRNIFLAALLVVLVPVSTHADRLETGPTLPGAASPLSLVLSAEARRIETIERIAPSVVCVFDSHRRGGGSGVLIDPHGYGLTNYHVAAGMLDKRKGWGGLADGVLYELEVLGIDVTGDVAMFRLIPPKAEFAFPFASLGMN